MMSFKCSKECHPDTHRGKISPSDIRKKSRFCHSNGITEERNPLPASEKGYKIDYKSFTVVKKLQKSNRWRKFKRRKSTKNCVHGLLHERVDVKKFLEKYL